MNNPQRMETSASVSWLSHNSLNGAKQKDRCVEPDYSFISAWD